MTDTAKLEKRIAATLNNGNAGSDELSELILAVEAAATAANTAATAQREAAVDILAAPDPKAAHENVVAAELTRDRLRHALPPLRDRLAAALDAEASARFDETYRRGEALLAQEAENFARAWDLMNELRDIFQSATATDKALAAINSEAATLSGEFRRLRSTELTARGLEQFSRDEPSIMKTCVLPSWQNSAHNVWPPPQMAFGASYALSMEFPSHTGGVSGFIGPGWETEEMQERFQTEREKERQRQTTHYQQMSKQQEERINAEERERAVAVAVAQGRAT
jgi:hypothetical protein